MTRSAVLSDAMWARIEPLLPPVKGPMGRPMRAHRLLVEAAIYRYRCGIAWRDLPAEFGPWQTAWKRHARLSRDGTWDKVLAQVLAVADANDELDWTVSSDSTIARAHQHATNLTRETAPLTGRHTGGTVELQRSAG
jgi:transposase